MTFQCTFVLILVFFSLNVICEQLINMFTNIEAAQVITLAFKSSIEISLFQ